MNRRLLVFLIVLLFIVVVGGVFVLIGVIQGDKTSVDRNGGVSAPALSRTSGGY
ncbi:hypothetical protein [Nocardioides flavescens]|uniref:Uncharacterized protein n=1 Tax=Nocardioides flavescens TaxID=2691959 RepID=A0A6L7F3I0_9ACTN|nr:hypothetical protein [Nocardioides flavescens]MXG91775.1 hypothetical protein [Nocardioides flavescens]